MRKTCLTSLLVILLSALWSVAYAVHWPPPKATPSWMQLAGNLTIDGSPPQAGDEVAVFGATGNLVGVFPVTNPNGNFYGAVPIFAFNPATPEEGGARQDEALTIKVWSASKAREYSGSELTLTPTSDYVAFQYNPAVLPLAYADKQFVGLNIAAVSSGGVVVPVVPGAPGIGTATAGNGEATISFTAPSDGGSPITLYTVTSTPDNKSNTGASSPIKVAGLTNGTSYTFTVTATNAVGTGPASAVSNSVTPGGVPGAPSAVSATAGNGQVTITFTAPADGGSAITGYTVTSTPENKSANGASSPLTITGLTNGTAYTFTVTASNAFGTGAASTSSNSVTPAGIPGAPTEVSARFANGSATVSFVPPPDNGSAITGYTVTSSPGNLVATGGGSPITVSGLSTGTPYTFTVAASNALGTGPSSASSAAPTAPGVPTGVQGTPGNGEVTVTFTAPADGGSAITSYTVTSAPGNVTATGSTTSIKVTGLTNGTPYTFTVTASNAFGTGAASGASLAATPLIDSTPVLTVSTLPDKSVTSNATLNVAGSVTSGNGIKSLTVNGTAVALDTEGNFSTAVTLLEGPNSIAVVATDKVDKQSTDTRSVILDITAPALAISAPADNSTTKETVVTLTGSVSDANLGTVTATVGSSSPQSASVVDGQFSVTVYLAGSGTNTITIVATDLAGNSNTAKRTIFSDPASPELSITDPGQDITIHSPSYLLKSSVTDATTITVTITAGGKSYTPAIAADGSFQQLIEFGAENTYAVTVVATDAAGNSTTVQRNFIYTLNNSGELNGDGVVDISDALLALQIAIGTTTPTSVQLARGDVAPLVSGKPQPDGVIDVGDALVILEKSVNLVSW